jgi:hypothetical protein
MKSFEIKKERQIMKVKLSLIIIQLFYLAFVVFVMVSCNNRKQDEHSSSPPDKNNAYYYPDSGEVEKPEAYTGTDKKE